jgi:hypothetical protein
MVFVSRANKKQGTPSIIRCNYEGEGGVDVGVRMSVGGCGSKHTVIAISTLLKGLIRRLIIVYRFCSNDPKITNKTYFIQLTYRRGYRKDIRKEVIRVVWLSFPKNGNPFPNPFLLMFLRCLKVHTHFYYLFAEIGYGFPRS